MGSYLPHSSTKQAVTQEVCHLLAPARYTKTAYSLPAAVSCSLGLVGYTRDASLDGLKVAEVATLERRNGVLVRDHLKVVVELVNKGNTLRFFGENGGG